MTPTSQDWLRLGQAVKAARKAAGLRDTKAWVDKVGRSSRILLGLERGEPVGEETLERIENALGWPTDHAQTILVPTRPDLALQRQLAQVADPVGPGPDAAEYVAHPGERKAGGLTDEEALALIRENRRLADELERRITGGGT